MSKYICVFFVLCSILGCADRNPTDPDSTAPHQESVAPNPPTVNNDNPTVVLNRAITALGGDSAREKLKVCRIVTRSVIAIPAMAHEMDTDAILIEDCFCYPDKWRRTIRRATDDSECMLFVLNGDNHWARCFGKDVQAMPLPAPNMRKPALLAALDQVTAARESKQEIVIGPNEQVAGQTLIPLTIMAGGHPQSTTFFDRSTGLIMKDIKYYLPDLHEPPSIQRESALAQTTTTYGDYKDFEGVVLPTHMIASQAGKTIFDASILEVEFPTEFDDSLFEKPRNE